MTESQSSQPSDTVEDFRGFASRPLRFEPHMSEAEALMWQVEKDPWLDPSGAVVSFLDGPASFEALRERLAYAVATIPRLRERVVPGLGALSPPRWIPDAEFELDYHLRHLALPGDGTERQLLDLVAGLYQDPFDRTRPLWRFWLIDNIEGNRTALVSKMHHTIADGIGAIRLAEVYMDISPESEPTPAVDLDAIIAAAAAASDDSPGISDRIQDAVTHQMRRQGGILRRAAGEIATWGADPLRPVDAGSKSLAATRAAARELFGGGEDPTADGPTGGSPLWKDRSRQRHLEGFVLDLAKVKAAAKARGGTVNDLFMTGIAQGAIGYHTELGHDLQHLNMTYIVSTRDDAGIGGNSFTPRRLGLSGAHDFDQQFASINQRTSSRKSSTGPNMDALAGLAAALPTMVLSQMARQQTADIDIATSNLRAAPFTCYIAGAKVLHNYPIGPLAGTACNITTLSYDSLLGVGIFSDPAAIHQPELLRQHIVDAFASVT